MDNTVYSKSLDFAKRIVRLYQFLCDTKKEYIISKQIMRSGTSIGANIAEAQCGISRKDFLAKMYIAFKECNETLYWLELLYSCQYIDKQMYESVYADCTELRRMLSSITKTTARKSQL